MRANASVVSVMAGQPFSNLPGRRASSATLRRAAPVFKTRVERETYQIGGIEGCLDKGEIIAGRRFSPIAEIELELKSGDRRELFTLARQISAIVPAEVSVKSKSERGYDFVDGIKDRWIRARDPVLPRFPTVADAFQNYLRRMPASTDFEQVRCEGPHSRSASPGASCAQAFGCRREALQKNPEREGSEGRW